MNLTREKMSPNQFTFEQCPELASNKKIKNGSIRIDIFFKTK